MNNGNKKFAAGFAIALILAIALNVVLHLLTRGDQHGDGFEEVGFPFVFYRMGGFAGIEEFRVLGLLSDISFAVIVALLTGYGCRSVRRNARDEKSVKSSA
jgi:hypothetical protein